MFAQRSNLNRALVYAFHEGAGSRDLIQRVPSVTGSDAHIPVCRGPALLGRRLLFISVSDSAHLFPRRSVCSDVRLVPISRSEGHRRIVNS